MRRGGDQLRDSSRMGGCSDQQSNHAVRNHRSLRKATCDSQNEKVSACMANLTSFHLASKEKVGSEQRRNIVMIRLRRGRMNASCAKAGLPNCGFESQSVRRKKSPLSQHLTGLRRHTAIVILDRAKEPFGLMTVEPPSKDQNNCLTRSLYAKPAEDQVTGRDLVGELGDELIDPSTSKST
ncbi:cytokinesis regulator [Pseudozyma hubeiensis SY62]|uniref:Cytokinesis regulator n=1 Tax=Pseudozyma hubeiensis (strain SY62) TaxID=1305764 RepID=R9PN31_PSEHS|nr:cytokinesis regulator [Pseudozyma hubeiensis SY62]GAC99535.1 cytokinesis regulator [Pseudozyma hubeiensis SY62]